MKKIFKYSMLFAAALTLSLLQLAKPNDSVKAAAKSIEYLKIFFIVFCFYLCF